MVCFINSCFSFLQVESVAQNMILSLLFQFLMGKETIEIHEAEECQPLVDTLKQSLIPSISIRSKAAITVLKKKTSSQCHFMQMELTSTELEYIAEILFEMAASNLKQYLGFSNSEILQIYQEVIASDPTTMAVFEAFNVLDDNDFMAIQMSALQSESSDAIVKETYPIGMDYSARGWLHCMLVLTS